MIYRKTNTKTKIQNTIEWLSQHHVLLGGSERICTDFTRPSPISLKSDTMACTSGAKRHWEKQVRTPNTPRPRMSVGKKKINDTFLAAFSPLPSTGTLQ